MPGRSNLSPAIVSEKGELWAVDVQKYKTMRVPGLEAAQLGALKLQTQAYQKPQDLQTRDSLRSKGIAPQPGPARSEQLRHRRPPRMLLRPKSFE